LKQNKKNFATKFYVFLCPFSVLAIALFIYYTSVPIGTKARTKLKKINRDVA